MRFANFVISELKKRGWFKEKKITTLEVAISVKDIEEIKELIKLLEKYEKELPEELKKSLKEFAQGFDNKKLHTQI